MKLRLLLSLIFFVATTLSALHELEHIKSETNNSTCLVCTVSHNLVSADTPQADLSYDETLLKDVVSTYNDVFVFKLIKTDNHSNAPPLFS